MGRLFVPPTSTVSLLAASAIDIVAPDDLNINTLDSVLIPANTLGLNGILRITYLWNTDGDANQRRFRIELDGNNLVLESVSNAIPVSSRGQIQIANSGVANAQNLRGLTSSASTFGLISGLATVLNIDTTIDQTILFTAQKLVTPTNLISLVQYSVELLRI